MLKYEKIIRLAQSAIDCPELQEIADFHITRIINSEIYLPIVETGINEGRIEAIRKYRDMYGVDLDTAKVRLEQYFTDNALKFKEIS